MSEFKYYVEKYIIKKIRLSTDEKQKKTEKNN